MMEFELVFTLLAILLALFVLKIVFLAFSNPVAGGDTVTSSVNVNSSVNEGSVVKQTVVDKGLRVRCTKGRRKRVKFVVDVAVNGTIDRYAGSENPATVEEERKDENPGDRAGDQTEENGFSRGLGGKITKGQSCDDAQDKGSTEIGMQIKKDSNVDELEKEQTSASGGHASVVVEGSENPSTVEEERKDKNSGQRVIDQSGENGLSQDLGGEIIKGQTHDDAQHKGSLEIEIQIEKDCNGDELERSFSEKEKTSASGGPAGVVFEEEKKDEVFENDDVKIDQKEGNLERGGLSQDLGGEIIKERSYDDAQDKASPEIEIQIEKDCTGDELEKEKTLASGGPLSVVVEEETKDKACENDEVKIDQKEGNREGGGGENDELITGDKSFEVGDEDWEGIERSELERVFAEAVNYMEYGFKDKEDDQLAKVLGNDVQLQLYGLHKVAVEGPCHEPQPMALKLSARAKWNAWQKLGSMSQDEAMEQYVKLLSDGIPGWMHNYSAGDGIEGSRKVETLEKMPDPEYERKLELTATAIGASSTGHGSVKKDDTL